MRCDHAYDDKENSIWYQGVVLGVNRLPPASTLRRQIFQFQLLQYATSDLFVSMQFLLNSPNHGQI